MTLRARRLDRLVSVDDVHRAARTRLPRPVYDFVAGGAETERTVRANRAAFEPITFRPRTLVDVSGRDLSTTVLGRRVELPVLLAPAGLARLVHPEGEVAVARAAGRSGTVFCVSTASSCSIEDVAAAATGALWFQLYLWRDREVVARLVDRARTAGYEALVLTVDVPVVGQRERDLRNGMTLPPRITPRNILDASWRVAWWWGLLRGREITFENLLDVPALHDTSATSLGQFVNQEMVNPAATWDELRWLKELWDGPIVVKGVLTADDARRAVDHGAAGVIVSNHGGRQLDGAPPSITMLPEVVAAVGDDIEVYLDGGIRRGSDVVKALALGARAVLVGRPYFWGLAVAGDDGVAHVMDLLRAEISRTLALIGCRHVADLDEDLVQLPPQDVRDVLIRGRLAPTPPSFPQTCA